MRPITIPTTPHQMTRGLIDALRGFWLRRNPRARLNRHRPADRRTRPTHRIPPARDLLAFVGQADPLHLEHLARLYGGSYCLHFPDAPRRKTCGHWHKERTGRHGAQGCPRRGHRRLSEIGDTWEMVLAFPGAPLLRQTTIGAWVPFEAAPAQVERRAA